MTAVMRTRRGDVTALPTGRWFGAAQPEELAALALARPPVLDVGCGPGRHTHALAERGLVVLGIDAAPTVVHAARRRGVAVLERSVFAPLPGHGRWATVLLLDGNIGIGGDPSRLLRRSADLLAPDGAVLVELLGPGQATEIVTGRIERDGQAGPWFPWALVGVDGIAAVAGPAGLYVAGITEGRGRWFAQLLRR
jgi:SAM-dependent methyltransferase